MKLKVLIQDEKDLEVISSLLQDAIVRVGDIGYLHKQRRLAMSLNRFCWEDQKSEPQSQSNLNRRVNCGFHFDGVGGLKANGINQSDKEALLYLLAIEFEPGEDGAGRLIFRFAGGATLAAQVECLDGAASDYGDPWISDNIPSHDPIS